MRTFIALVPPVEVSAALARAANELLGGVHGLRLYPAQDLHVTLAFLGPVMDSALERLGRELERACAGLDRAETRATHTGAFPARGRERVLWAGLENADSIATLMRAAIAASRSAGCEPSDAERTPWTPHITLARVRGERVRVPTAFYELAFDLPWTAREVVVCQSDPRPDAPLRYPIARRVVL